MGSVQVSIDGAGDKGSLELNFHTTRNGQNGVKNGHVVGEGQGFSEEEESRVNEVAEDMNDGRRGTNQSLPAALQQQQHLGPIVRWERFLPLRSLKVLLVENDDSTRQVVSALLRNCSYEVTTAANGLQAWKILEDLTNHIDIVLTEVVMPCLSGIGLLCKIMSHKTCKNIPVIMMSSLDSMGIVFKCLSKGAVDFLVKPIRKNELKILWQHVWRRCHSSSGSGSESGIQTQQSAKAKSVDETDNNTSSNDENGNGSIGLNVGDGSDNGSATQSSWTKRAVEVDSPQPISPWDQQADPHDSTCAQVIHPKSETLCNQWVPMTVTTECEERKEQRSDNVEMGKVLEIGVSTNPDLQLDSYPKKKVSMIVTGGKKDKLPKQLPTKDIQSNEISDKATADPEELPSLELSLKRLRPAGDGGIVNRNNRNVLRHSDLSAFSRYNTATAAAAQATGYGESCSLPLDNGSDVMKTESMYNLQSNSNATPLNQQSNGSSNNNDMGSTAKTTFTKPAALEEKSVSTSAAKCVNPSSAFHPVQQCRTCPSQQVMLKKVDSAPTAALGQPSGAHHQVQVQHHHQHYRRHHHHHHVHCMQQPLPPDPDDLFLKNMAAAAPQCGSSNVFGGHMEGNAGNYSLNGSISGSNHGSNGQNGSSTAVNAGAINMESDNGLAGKSRAGGESGCGSGVDQNRFAQREAALTKFRQKRKERCFEKKVRYQSRKRLAEQRPRVRGQFVRQIVYEHTSQDNNC